MASLVASQSVALILSSIICCSVRMLSLRPNAHISSCYQSAIIISVGDCVVIPVYQGICHQSLALYTRLEARKAKSNAKVHIVGVGLRESSTLDKNNEWLTNHNVWISLREKGKQIAPHVAMLGVG